jgi:type VI secretion system ImpJ/VasE family protein
MFLRPQHFQQQERYVEALVEGRAAPLRPYAWGATELQVNEDLLAIGKFGLRRLAGVLPDGTVVNAPGDIDLPEPVDIPEDARGAIVYAALAPRQPGGAEFSRKAGGLRYTVGAEETVDSFAETRNAESLETARPNLRLAVTKEQTEGRVLLGLARVAERREQRVLLDPKFIPSSLTLSAHEALTGAAEDIAGRVAVRAEELARRSTAKLEAGAETLISFLMLQCLNKWGPALEHFRACPGHHPETLYGAFLQMAGELSTFTSASRRPPALPAYDHLDLRACYQPVLNVIIDALSAVFDRSAIQLDVENPKPGAYICPIRDRSLFRNSSIFLAVSAQRPPAEIARLFPPQMKIGNVTKMQELVRAAVTGVAIRPVTTLPPQMPVFHEFTYFQFDTAGPGWTEIANLAPAIGLALSGDWPGLKLEIWAVRRQT